MKTLGTLQALVVLALFGIATYALAYVRPGAAGPRRVYTTLGEVQAVHASVKVAGSEVRGVRRFGEGEALVTGDNGRGRARLDDGTSVVMDRGTRLSANAAGVTLQAGRIFVQGAPGAHTEVRAAGATAIVATSTLAVDMTPDGASFFCASGEVMVHALGRETRVRSGETASVTASDIKVAPEKAFNDWTSGMAYPWSASGRPRAAIGELWGRHPEAPDGPESPLALRNHEVNARIVGEVATTQTRTTYFNAGSSAVVGDFRMALPPGAIVSGFGVGKADDATSSSSGPTGEVRLASDADGDPTAPKLEWAGEGWLRGTTGPIAPGETSVVTVSYVEWLSPSDGRLTYRYPMLAEGTPPLIGEFHARVDADAVNATAVGVGVGGSVEGGAIEVRRADFRPTSDLVVDFELRPGAFRGPRAYVVQAPAEDPAGAFVLVRSELSPREAPKGVTLALLLDTSRSIDPTLLDAERALCEALLTGLGPEDRAVVFAADETARPVGPATVGAVDPARREAIVHALATLRPGGATDLGAALERAADALPADDASATLLYLGDGWPTLGDDDADAIRTRLSRRKGGVPRLGAVAVGPSANRFGLAALVRGGGPVLGIDDRAEAAEVAVQLLAEALKPSIAGVEVDLGPQVERVYPRGAHALRLGETMTTTGRLRGLMPDAITLRYRAGAEDRREVLPLTRLLPIDRDDVRRRWSLARVEELMLRGGGREAVVDAALRNSLLTPWTGWTVGVAAAQAYRATPLWARVLDPGLDGSLAVFSARFATPPVRPGTLSPPTDEAWPKPGSKADGSLREAALASARRTLDEALGSGRQCPGERAAMRVLVGGAVQVNVTLGPDGRVRETKAVAATNANDDDPSLDRCIELVVQNLTFYPSGLSGLTLTYSVPLRTGREPGARTCSGTSKLPSAMRRGVWFERLHRGESAQNPLGALGEHAYSSAKERCELPTWADRRAFLELLLDRTTDGPSRIRLARLLEQAEGDSDAAAFVRREAVRRAQTPEELEAIRGALRDNEPDVGVAFVNDYAKASGDAGRLAVVESYLRLSPHDPRLRRRQLALFEALHQTDDLFAQSAEVRQDPFLNAALLADDASALRRAGREDEARRTFGELVERAPNVPFARAFLGDRMLDEGLFDEATTAYEALLRLVPEDPGASFRLALAHAGAGRLDVASRMFARVAQTGGRTSDPVLQELASFTSAVLLAEARAKHPAAADEERLGRRLLETPLPDLGAVVLVRAPTWVTGLRASTIRDVAPHGHADETTAPLRVPSLGIAGVRVERGEGPFRLRLGRQADLEPSRQATARVEALVLEADRDKPRLVSKDVPLPTDGSDVDVAWDGTHWL
jgi:tetratricopeptide (TPR) repeat protein